MDFSGPTIFRHTITHCGSCAAFFYVCSADTDFSEYRHLQMFLFERSFYERHIYERKAGLSADHVHGPANGHFDARKFSVQYRGQFLCRTDQ